MSLHFKCVTCNEYYLELEDLKGEISRIIVGICEPCCRLRIGDEGYELASERAIATVERQSTKHLKSLNRPPEIKG